MELNEIRKKYIYVKNCTRIDQVKFLLTANFNVLTWVFLTFEKTVDKKRKINFLGTIYTCEF